MRRALRWLLWLGVLPLAILAALLAAVWVWTGSNGSLATVLHHAPRFLPSGMALSTQGVTGSLRHGGTVGELQFSADGHSVQAMQLAFKWRPTTLWERHLQIDQLEIAALQVQPAPASADKTPPPNQLLLPITIDAPLRIGTLTLNGPTPFAASQLDLHYKYHAQQHTLQLNTLQVAAGRYSGKASLDGAAPLQLKVTAEGQVLTTVPGTTRSMALLGRADVAGMLSGVAPALQVHATLQPSAKAPGGQGDARLDATAQISPWADQPVNQADIRFTGIDLAALWPNAPASLLSGSLLVTPSPPTSAMQWQTKLQLRNDDPGPWDQKKLPVSALQTTARLVQAPPMPLTVHIDTLQMQAAGGQLQGTGQWQSGGATPWQGSVTLSQINPAAAYAALDPAALDGRVQARAVGPGIAFDIALTPSLRQPVATALARLPGLALRAANAQGSWSGDALQLDTLRIQTSDALLQGQLQLQPTAQIAQADLRLTSPGANARLRGTLAPHHGTGDITLNVVDAGQVMRWAKPILTALNGKTATAALPNLSGQANLTASWQGGWKKADAVSVRARVDAPSLNLQPAGAPAAKIVQIRDAQIQASGRLNALTFSALSRMATQGHQLHLQTDGTGGRSADGAWTAQINKLQAQASLADRTGTWTVALRQPVPLKWTPAQGAAELLAAAGEARITSPSPGDVTLSWSPVRMRAGNGPISLQTTGRLLGLPLAWVNLLGPNNALLREAGLKGDLVFDGGWDFRMGDQTQLVATLARRSGDISLRMDDDPASGTQLTQNAGVREARLKVESDGRSFSAAFQWDSANAGNIQANLGTEIARQGDAWVWPPEAKLSGDIRAQLPRVGAWTAFAPPGWRIRGTLDSTATIAGTRANPQWRGTLQANELSVRSVVEGIDLTGGKLRATIIGQRLDIEDFSFQGAGPDGGQLVAKGFAQWLPATRPGATTATLAAPALTRVQIDLNAKLTGLRVASRADRRLALSGDVRARLDDARLTVRGALAVDSALFILPDQNTPSLGDDVFVKGRNAPLPPTPANAVRVIPDVSLTLVLGPEFRVQGRGLATRLAGELNLRNAAMDGRFAPRLTGEVRTVKGSYKAYGQQLDIEQGVLRFVGPYDNPSLDIRAIRPNITQRVGVEITGSVLAPRVRLFSDPSLPDAEALAWLVLGRSATGGGAEAAVLQQAALALLGGSGKGMSATLMEALGLDELSFRSNSTAADGTAAGAAVTLGKRLSKDFYVAYERSLASTLGTFFIFYDLSRYFTVRGQTGETSAIDLIFTAPYD